LTCRQDPEGVIDQQKRTGVNTLQLVDEFPIDQYSTLRRNLPGVRLVQVIHVHDGEILEHARLIAAHVDALLMDSGNPLLPVKELGGTGRVHNWSISREIRDSVDCPVYLAGGLNSRNVAQAVRMVNPFAVDVCSGVRTNGMLDKNKLSDFFDSLKRGKE
jgi:phosphoribosylanthranilate isomerase